MAEIRFSDSVFDRFYGSEGVVARRTWELVPAPGSVLLRGLFGFPWRDRDVQAKCTQRDYAGTADIFGSIRVDRHHPVVPSEGCTCGIYASCEPDEHWAMRRYLARRILVHGFVRLSGRVLFDGRRYRAERARIEGPLVVAVPSHRRWVRWSRRLGRTPRARILTDGDRYRLTYLPTWGSAAVPLDDWHQMVGERLMMRYGVPIEPPLSAS